jgi:hypothetical protein
MYASFSSTKVCNVFDKILRVFLGPSINDVGQFFRFYDPLHYIKCAFSVREIYFHQLLSILGEVTNYKDVSARVTGGPKFSDTLTLFQPGGKFCPPSQRSNLNYAHGFVPLPLRRRRIWMAHYVSHFSFSKFSMG